MLRTNAAGESGQSPVASRPGWVPAALGALVLGATSLVISAGLHGRWGHGPASAEPMNAACFTGEHEAFLVAAFVLVVGIALVGRASRRG